MNIKSSIIYAAILIAAFFATSCSKTETPDGENADVMVLASGHVYTNSQDNPQSIKDINLTLSAYSENNKNGEPDFQTAIKTNKEGLYLISLEYLPNYQYILTAEDTDGSKNLGQFKSSKIKLNFSKSPKMNPETGLMTHFFWNIDFHLNAFTQQE